MEENIKITQIDAPFVNKLDAMLIVSRVTEVSKETTFLSTLSELVAGMGQIEEMKKRNAELMDLLASICVAQEFTEEEFEEVKNMMTGGEEMTVIVAGLKELVAKKIAEKSIEKIGDISTKTFLTEEAEA